MREQLRRGVGEWRKGRRKEGGSLTEIRLCRCPCLHWDRSVCLYLRRPASSVYARFGNEDQAYALFGPGHFPNEV